ncbi:acylglycerol kinase, mitochondrial [Trichonephila inaurata madagascariensis]|uniref:Acylglycerol kinase, mitochondrial n=1 Tax=Trichonephila inaurata madagascariensis TaxID=2747483 RepID=A0A8X7BUT8_9ARAC|nr:acylglycerol kinase, mitochondrial [Trichonephila inaurata madagascariensis]
MSRIIKTAQMLRRNWKKSTFFFGVFMYGASNLAERYRTFQMMRAYCEEARKYGEKPLPNLQKPKHVTVILNPLANYSKSNVQFEKYAAPLLHLAGYRVSVFQTENQKQAENLMEIMANTDAVLIAGGDGTLQEAVTGLLRRPGVEEEFLPMGIVPLGKTNTVAEHLFGSKASSHPQLMAEAVMAVIRESTTKMDVLKVQFIDEDKPIYGMVTFEQGILGDVEPFVEKYWYLGFLKDKFTYFKDCFKDWKPIENEQLEYIAPCSGCSKCYVPPKKKIQVQSSRWWQMFMPRRTENIDSTNALKINEDLATRVNEDCGKRIPLPSGYSNISVSTSAADPEKPVKSGTMYIKIFPENLSKKEFIFSGLSHRKSKLQDSSSLATVIEARQLIIQTDKEVDFSNNNPTSVAESQSIDVPGMTSVAQNELASPVSIGSVVAASPIENETISSLALDSNDSVEVTSPIQENAISTLLPEDKDSIEVTDASQPVNQEESSSSLKSENTVNTEDEKNFSYIDKEKYKRASCIISILPKQVTMFA